MESQLDGDFVYAEGYYTTAEREEGGEGGEGDYDALEDWYSASFPRIPSASAGFSSTPTGIIGTAFNTLLSTASTESCNATDAITLPSTCDHTEPADWIHELQELEENVDDYEIELDAPTSTSSNVSPLAESSAPLTSSPITDGSGRRREYKDPEEADTTQSFLEFVPKKLFARRTTMPVRDTVAGSSSRCCVRCHSDLNGKLIAKCAMCHFKCHLYCFSPPLKQHPALLALANSSVPRHKRLPLATLMAQWRCESCVARVGSAPSPENKWNVTATTTVMPRDPRKRKTPTRITTSDPKTKTKPSPTQHRQQQSSLGFDWYAFRAAKFDKVVGTDRGEDEDENGNSDSQNLRNQLAFYSPSDALLKKTALFWQQHVHKRKQLRDQHATRLLKCRLPVKRALGVELSPREALEVAASNQTRKERECQEQQELFDDALVYRFDDPRPVFQTLRRTLKPRPPSAVGDASVSTSGLSDDARERLARDDFEREATESQWMATEDDDAPTPAQAARLARRRAQAAAMAREPGVMGLYLAARIIERVIGAWLKRARGRVARRLEAERREKHELQLMHVEEGATRRRRARAQALHARVRYLVLFVLVMVRAQRRLQLKKEMVLLLNDVHEDRQIRTQDTTGSNHNDQNMRLAERRIQRFFLRRVRRYIQLRKRMMVRRLVKWWKRRHYAYRFRALAVLVRHRHRHRAACCIQRTFRAFKVYKSFQTLREKLLMRKLRRFLSDWLIKRVVRKEAERVAILQASIAIGVCSQPHTAPLGEILKALGVFLYEHSDFWNAAAVLERVSRTRKDLLDPELQFVLAYCHHMAWYASCSGFHLQRAMDQYRSILSIRDRVVDPFVLQELALVLMHLDDFRGSLTILARLIELFRDEDSFPLWLLLAGVQLQQVGQWLQSVDYLRYLSDLVLPSPYEERDVLALCAMSYEKVGTVDAQTSAKEAWRAAVRLWTMEKKLLRVQQQQPQTGAASDFTVNVALTKNDDRSKLSRLRKWELLVDLAQRASDAGHYLVACRVLLFALETIVTAGNHDWQLDQQRAWWMLGDAFRHLGKLELYVEATKRSRSGQANAASTEENKDEVDAWRVEAETQATSFETELKTLTVRQHVDQLRQQYDPTHANAESMAVMENDWHWRLEDADAGEY